MGDNEGVTLVKLILMLGIVFIFVTGAGSLYPTNGPGNAFDSFTNTVRTGVTVPTFNNPFASTVTTTLVNATANGPTGQEPDSATGCPLATYWQCVRFPNQPSRFIRWDDLNNPLRVIGVNMTAPTQLINVYVSSAVITMTCRSNATLTTSLVLVPDGVTTTPSTKFPCPAGGTGGNFTTSIIDFCSILCGNYNATTNINNPGMTAVLSAIDFHLTNNQCTGVTFNETTPCEAGKVVDITYISMTVAFQPGTVQTCAFNLGNNPFDTVARATGFIGCEIGLFAGLAGNLFVFIYNMIVFVTTAIANILVFFATAAVNLFVGFINAMVWFFNVPADDTAPCPTNCVPKPVQTFISAFFVAFMAYTTYLVTRIIAEAIP